MGKPLVRQEDIVARVLAQRDDAPGLMHVISAMPAQGRNVKLQCWGHTLTQATNLHLMLAMPNCSFFEQPTPYEGFEHAALDVIRTDRGGFVHAPSGIGVDWKEIETVSLGCIVVNRTGA